MIFTTLVKSIEFVKCIENLNRRFIVSFWNSLFGFTQQQPITVPVELLARHGVGVNEQQAMARWIRSAKPHQLSHINPYYLADDLKLPLRELLQLLAPAVTAGLFCLNWDVQCPFCGYQQEAFDSLDHAYSKHTCVMCRGTFEAHLDDEVIVTFSINETVRSDASQNADWRKKIDQQYGHLKGHELLTVQPFRDFFINEPLPLTESFQVRRLALLFTDLGGSTALYARRGDPFAYGLVRAHFDILLDVINQNNGAVVKTIGDAIMAVFSTSDAALKAALAGQQAMNGFNQEQKLVEQDHLLLKIGIHSGPCLVVTLNERLDYFGTTVNAAARIQAQAKVNQIAFSEELHHDLTDKTLLAGLKLQKEQLILRGLDERPFVIYRAQVER